jgi:alpha-methylacyl-CoA racemase
MKGFRMSGPLAGLRVIELAGIGPGPHAAMILADLGADVVRVSRPGARLFPIPAGEPDALLRGRRELALDLKDVAQLSALLSLVEHADVLLEGFRPGVAERLGLGPDGCRRLNPRLVYARITGWGQDGPLAARAGHDLNYVAITGVLNAIGRPGERPPPPLNLIGDFGGGSMLTLVGILSALIERSRSGVGQVVDAAMVDGATLLAQMMWSWRGAGVWHDERGANYLDGGAPFYDTYECADGKYVAVGAIEPAFFAELARVLELDFGPDYDHTDPANWVEQRARLTAAFATRTRHEWTDVFGDLDACVSPVLDFAEAETHPHLAARRSHVRLDGVVQSAPAPRFSRTPAGTLRPPAADASDIGGVNEIDGLLAEWRGRTD